MIGGVKEEPCPPSSAERQRFAQGQKAAFFFLEVAAKNRLSAAGFADTRFDWALEVAAKNRLSAAG